MSIERISTIQTASVITQPVDATERLTLIEKLEKEYKKWCDVEDNAESDMQAYQARGAYRAIRDCIDIVKQHSDWVSVKEKPAQRGRYLVYTTDGSVFDCRYSQDCWHKDTIGYRDILYWMPLPPTTKRGAR